MNDIIKTGAILDGLKTLSDGTLKLSFALNEVPNECAASIIGLHRTFGWLLFSPTEQVEIPNEPPPEFKNDKSPSARLRAVLFVLHQQEKSEQDFDSFYKQKMEMIIGWVKNKLDN